MENFVFENSTKAYFGRHCVGQYLPELLSHYGKTVMVAYGGGSIKRTGIYDEIMEILTKAEKDVVEFSGIMANPTYAKVLEGAKIAKEQGVDLILLSAAVRSWTAAKPCPWLPSMTVTCGLIFGLRPAPSPSNLFR